MLNSIEWVNPIAGVIASVVDIERITCDDIKGYVIRAYDDDGFILLLLKPERRAGMTS